MLDFVSQGAFAYLERASSLAVDPSIAETARSLLAAVGVTMADEPSTRSPYGGPDIYRISGLIVPNADECKAEVSVAQDPASCSASITITLKPV